MNQPVPEPQISRPGAPAPRLLLTAHGSRDPRAAVAHDALLARIRALRPDLHATVCYVDHTTPSVAHALDRAAGDDVDVVVVPLLLTKAAHSKGDVPGAIQAARRTHPSLHVRYARVLGPHPLLLAAVQAGLRAAGVPEQGPLVLAATGSADPEANAEIARAARLLWERRRGAPVEVGFASATGPSVADALDRLRRLGEGRAAVAAYFLAPGRLLDVVVHAAEAAGAVVTGALADTDEVARLALERYAESRAGRAAVNCDCCVYRTPWPGHERRVGAPQTAHSHPGDPPVHR